jgi:muramoyltetrapeptide carboxypeptidase
MTTPSFLKKGDTVLLIATARARSMEQLAPALEILRKWGLNVETGPNLYKRHHQFAGTDEERIHDLQWAIRHPKAKAVILAGGGYGTLRIIDSVNFSYLKKFPKWFVGYSDATVLQARLIKQKTASIHGTMAFQFEKNEAATRSLKNALFGKKLSYPVKPHHLNRIGKASAEVIGGNLSLIYALSGSKDDLDTKNKILFIEDLDEQLYHIDRMMLQLKRSGKLRHLAGLIVGGMSDMKDNAVAFGKTAEEIVAEAVKDYNYPVCYNFPAGHIDENMAIYFGVKAELNVQAKNVKLNYQFS